MAADRGGGGGIAGSIAGLAEEVSLLEQVQEARAMIAKAGAAQRASADSALGLLAAHDRQPLAKGVDLAALSLLVEQAELRDRVAGHLAEAQPPEGNSAVLAGQPHHGERR